MFFYILFSIISYYKILSIVPCHNTYTVPCIRADIIWSLCCCCSVTQSCLTLCDPMDCSMPGLHVPLHLPKFAQVHVHCMGDAIRPSHSLTPSSSAFNLSQHQGFFPVSRLFTSSDQNIGAAASASVLPMSIHGWSPCSPSGYQESPPAPQFEGIKSLAICLLYDPALTTTRDTGNTEP